MHESSKSPVKMFGVEWTPAEETEVWKVMELGQDGILRLCDTTKLRAPSSPSKVFREIGKPQLQK